jgi:hypothetical protein
MEIYMSIKTIEKYLEQYQNRFYKYSHREHIERWLSQFDNQDIIVKEIAHIMDQVFVEESNENVFFQNLLKNKKIIEDIGKPGTYSILNIQSDGKSQAVYSKKMKSVFKDILDEDVPINDFSKNVLIYVDDFMFSGMKARHDVINLFKTTEKRTVVYIFIGVHTNADYYLNKSFSEQRIDRSVWRCFSFENQLRNKDNSDVFWPKSLIGTNAEVQKYKDKNMTRELIFRSDSSTSIGDLKLFSSSKNREIIENEFLLAGIRIINECDTEIPPLGLSAFEGMGFGGTAMSYRNIPNNTPLCLWWGNPNKPGGLGSWYPLMMRRVYD